MSGNLRTLSQKVWDSHLVAQESGAPALIYSIDLHLVHEVTSPQAPSSGLPRSRMTQSAPLPDLTPVATVDHSIPTSDRSLPIMDPIAAAQVGKLEQNCKDFGIPCYGVHSSHQGIVHVIGPELGLTQPGMTVVCGDSHTATAMAHLQGHSRLASEPVKSKNVLATQCLLQRPSKTFKVQLNGTLKKGVSAKDIILNLISQIGIGGGTGTILEYAGPAISALNMEERMTVCNMSIEGGARAGMIAPDDTTFQYLCGRQFAPKGPDWDAAVARWRQLPSDAGAKFDREIVIDGDNLDPMITWGTNPGMGVSINGAIPGPLVCLGSAGARVAHQSPRLYGA